MEIFMPDPHVIDGVEPAPSEVKPDIPDYEYRKLESEFAGALRRGAQEIRDLRMTIDHLAPKAEAYEQLKIVLGLLPKPLQGAGEDLAWRFDQRANELTRGKMK
jgi:hypothetical protein